MGKKATELRKETQQSKTTSYNTLDSCTGVQLLIIIHTKFTNAFYTGIPPSDWKDPAMDMRKREYPQVKLSSIH